MVRRALALLSALACLAIVGAVLSPSVEAAGKKKPLKKLTLDPNAEEIELFKGVEEGKLKVDLVPMNAFGGNVFIENLTDKPLTVKLPQAAVTVPKHLAQFGGFGGGGQGGFGGGQGGFGGGQGGFGGGQQQGGGGFGGQGGFGGGQGGGGQGGFFGGGGGGFGSIPPEQIAVVPMNTVCLQHGKPEPSPRSDYTLVPVEKFSTDPVLPQFLAMVGTGKIDQQTAQAAAWHLTDKMSWEQLANKPVTRIGQAPTPYFSTSQLLAAQALVAQAKKMADEAPAAPASPTTPATGRVSGAAAK